METFNIEETSKSLFTQVSVSSILRATTGIYLIINGKFIKPGVAYSDDHENGNIDLDDNNNLQSRDLGLANTYVGNQLLFITTIYGLPDTITTDGDTKTYVLANIEIDYTLSQDNSTSYKMNINDTIVLDTTRTAIVYKKIQL